MSNVTKLPEDLVKVAKLRLQLDVSKANLRKLTAENRVLQSEKRQSQIENKKLNGEIAKLREVAALVPTLQSEVSRLAAGLEKCKRSKSHSNSAKNLGPQSWMGR